MDISDIVKDSVFKVFKYTVADGGVVRGIVAEGLATYTRADLDELTYMVKQFGASGLIWLRVTPEGFESPIAKFLTPDETSGITSAFRAEPGDLILIMADMAEVVDEPLAMLAEELMRRNHTVRV